MLDFDRERVRENARQSGTEDLLDRLTVYRAGMEPEALEVIEAELRSRGVTTAQIRAHEGARPKDVIFSGPGLALRCSFCHGPAVAREWRWRRLWRILPPFPRPVYLCAEHLGRK